MAKKSKSSWQPFHTKPQKKQKPVPHVVQEDSSSSAQSAAIPVALQQSLLNAFRDACTKGPPAEIEATLQEVKGHLYNRDFATAFGKDEYLDAYAARWSPSRALGYVQVFLDINPFIAEATGTVSETNEEPEGDDGAEPSSLADQLKDSLELDQHSESSATPKDLNLVCLGGGAGAEVVGLAGWLKYLQESASDEDSETLPSYNLNVLGVDIADWEKVMSALHHTTTTAPVLSRYASAAVVAANAALVSSDNFHVQFLQQDLLASSLVQTKDLVSNMDIVTIMFTLNELYTTSVPKTQALLLNLTTAMRSGALLLVVDSPGSYSTVTINGAEKKYPMQWLLDHTLLGSTTKKGEPAKWEKLVTDESRWFRLARELKYPIELENMRYQIHLYRRCEATRTSDT